MVLFITASDINENKLVEILCKQIVNVENNLNIYRMDGTMNNTPYKKNNVYKYNDVEYDLSSNVGVILFYNNESSEIANNNVIQTVINDIRNMLINIDFEINNIINLCDKYLPFNLNKYKSTNHTLLQNKISNSRGRNAVSLRDFTLEKHNIKKLLKSNRFVWMIKNIKPCIDFNKESFLLVSEYENHLPKSYLLQSINTIIIDKVKLFNVNNGLRQINYPSIQQYSCYNKNIFDITISISDIFDIDYEIARFYVPNITNMTSRISNTYSTISFESLKMYEIRRPNIDMKWYIQITEQYKYSEQEKQEKEKQEHEKQEHEKQEHEKQEHEKQEHEILNTANICFVSRMPLYGNIYLLDVGEKVVRRKKDVNGEYYKNINILNSSYILVSAYIFHGIYDYNNEQMSFIDYLFKLTKYEILNTTLVKYNISKYKALSSITNEKNSHILKQYINDKNFQMKKEILLSICKYGIYEEQMNYYKDNSYITVNTTTKKIYIGKCELSDADIRLIMNTDNIIYNIKII